MGRIPKNEELKVIQLQHGETVQISERKIAELTYTIETRTVCVVRHPDGHIMIDNAANEEEARERLNAEGFFRASKAYNGPRKILGPFSYAKVGTEEFEDGWATYWPWLVWLTHGEDAGDVYWCRRCSTEYHCVNVMQYMPLPHGEYGDDDAGQQRWTELRGLIQSEQARLRYGEERILYADEQEMWETHASGVEARNAVRRERAIRQHQERGKAGQSSRS